jgi:hypothetical protein
MEGVSIPYIPSIGLSINEYLDYFLSTLFPVVVLRRLKSTKVNVTCRAP